MRDMNKYMFTQKFSEGDLEERERENIGNENRKASAYMKFPWKGRKKRQKKKVQKERIDRQGRAMRAVVVTAHHFHLLFLKK